MGKKIKKIVLLGAESTGKSKLCELLADHYNTVFVPEFARIYFNEHDINHYTLADLEIIAKNQLLLEKEYLKKASQFLFCDTSLITIKIWATHMFNQVPDFVTKNIHAQDFDLYLITNNDVKWIQDDQRRNEDLREHLFKWNKHELQKLNVDYKIITGVDDGRFKNAVQLIDAFNKV